MASTLSSFRISLKLVDSNCELDISNDVYNTFDSSDDESDGMYEIDTDEEDDKSVQKKSV